MNPQEIHRRGSLAKDTHDKVNLAACVWLQSFFTESPLEGVGAKRLSPTLVKDDVRLVRDDRHYVQVKEKPDEVIAGVGPGEVLTADYKPVGGEIYPVKITEVAQGETSSVDDIEYRTEGSLVRPKSFWMNIPINNQSAVPYLHAEVSCSKN